MISTYCTHLIGIHFNAGNNGRSTVYIVFNLSVEKRFTNFSCDLTQTSDILGKWTRTFIAQLSYNIKQ